MTSRVRLPLEVTKTSTKIRAKVLLLYDARNKRRVRLKPEHLVCSPLPPSLQKNSSAISTKFIIGKPPTIILNNERRAKDIVKPKRTGASYAHEFETTFQGT